MANLLLKATGKFERGRIKSAKKILDEILDKNPGNPGALHLHGIILLNEGKVDEALVYLQQMASGENIKPCWYADYAHALEMKGFNDGAAKAYRLAEITGCETIGFYFLYGHFLTNIAKDFQKAELCFAKLITKYPNNMSAYVSLGIVYHAQGKYDQVIQVLEYTIKQGYKNATMFSNLGLALSHQGRSEAAILAFEEAIKLDPNNQTAISTMILVMLNVYDDQKYLYNKIRNIVKSLNKHAVLEFSGDVDLTKDKKLRLGFVSADLNQHAIANFITPILINLNKEQFSIYIYYNNHINDCMTATIRALADSWCDCKNMKAGDLDARIRNDKIDILIDLSNHTKGHRLDVFIKKPAPVLLEYMGLPISTGLNSIDYSFSNEYTIENCDLKNNASETVIALPWNHFFMNTHDFVVVEQPPFLKNGFITFGSFNGLRKVTSNMIEVWAEILSQVPNSKIRMVINDETNVDMQNFMHSLFANHGVDKSRIILAGRLSLDGYMKSHNEVDIALDSYPYNGSTTTYYSLMMGLPLVSCCGKSVASNNAYCILSHLGKEKWVGSNFDEYIKIAVEMANNRDFIVSTKATLREEFLKSKIMDHKGYIKNVEDALRKMWITFCDSRTK